MKQFTLEELVNFDGKEGRPAYFACKGLVYDTSGSFLWKGGRHQVFHSAGKDLTKELNEAPHGEDILERVPVVGQIKR